MLDIRWIRENPEALDDALAKRGAAPEAGGLVALDEKRRRLLQSLQEDQARRNEASKEVGKAKAARDEARAATLIAEVAELKARIQSGEEEERRIDAELLAILSRLPNTTLDEVPVGSDESENVEVRRHGERPQFGFAPREHFELGEALGLMEFDRAARMSGSRFTVLRGELARLERAIGQFMLDIHTREFGYEEVSPPLLVKSGSLYGTSQLPKFQEDLFEIRNEVAKAIDELRGRQHVNSELSNENEWLGVFNERFDRAMQVEMDRGGDVRWVSHLFDDLARKFTGNSERFRLDANYFQAMAEKFEQLGGEGADRQWLIPTAEVSLTNLVREETLDAASLPLRFAALTQCFRSEAGSAGRDTRGMLRQHQFQKCELVSITTAETSLDEHERMTGAAEEVLKRLGLHYRVVVLCTGDIGFSARKTYDIEVWLPGQDTFREISSCSVCGDFQARRMNARYRVEGEKQLRFVHTLNGSGTAVGRALIAVMENYQEADGSIVIPEALKPYMGGLQRIEARG